MLNKISLPAATFAFDDAERFAACPRPFAERIRDVDDRRRADDRHGEHVSMRVFSTSGSMLTVKAECRTSILSRLHISTARLPI
jgi:hypothetical protein